MYVRHWHRVHLILNKICNTHNDAYNDVMALRVHINLAENMTTVKPNGVRNIREIRVELCFH
jgi:hypothetical protein